MRGRTEVSRVQVLYGESAHHAGPHVGAHTRTSTAPAQTVKMTQSIRVRKTVAVGDSGGEGVAGKSVEA